MWGEGSFKQGRQTGLSEGATLERGTWSQKERTLRPGGDHGECEGSDVLVCMGSSKNSKEPSGPELSDGGRDRRREWHSGVESEEVDFPQNLLRLGKEQGEENHREGRKRG